MWKRLLLYFRLLQTFKVKLNICKANLILCLEQLKAVMKMHNLDKNFQYSCYLIKQEHPDYGYREKYIRTSYFHEGSIHDCLCDEPSYIQYRALTVKFIEHEISPNMDIRISTEYISRIISVLSQLNGQSLQLTHFAYFILQDNSCSMLYLHFLVIS